MRHERLKRREWFDEFKARNRNTNDTVLIARAKNGLDVKRMESRFPQLKECSNEHLMSYRDVVKQNDELWVVIPSGIN